MPQLFYISPRDVRKNRSDAVHIMLSCESFVNNGFNVELVTPSVLRNEYNIVKEEVFKLYGIENQRFKITELSTKFQEGRDYSSKGISVALKKLILVSFFIFSNLTELNHKETVVYSKCFISTIPFLISKRLHLIKSLIVFEVITPKNTFIHKFVFRKSEKIISWLPFVTDDIIKFSGTSPSKIFLAPFVSQFKEIQQVIDTKSNLRQRLGMRLDSFYILYAGKTGLKVKEVDYFISCAQLLPEYTFLIVGANAEAFRYYVELRDQLKIQNLDIFPFQNLPDYYRFVLSADMLIAYYPGTMHNRFHLAPGKAGIYFASKNPCIFSDLPSLRSIFPEGTVFYAEPDDPSKLASKIREVLSKSLIASQVAEKAYCFAKGSSYDNFTASVKKFITSNDK